MLYTISIGSCVLVQGRFVRHLSNGKTVVRIGERFFKGTAVTTQKAA